MALAHRLSLQERTEKIRSDERNQFVEFQNRPVEFVRDVLKLYPWSKQREILESVRDHPRTSVRSCHSSGKTTIAAAAALYFLHCYPGAVVVTTAPTGRQVKELLWREIRTLHSRAKLPGRCMTTSLELDDKWFAIGFSTNEADKYQGYHSEHLLAIMDEAAGITEDIYVAASGVLTNAGARLLLIGNPTSVSGTFFQSHHSARSLWNTISISARETPAFTGEKVPPVVLRSLVSEGWVADRKAEWGEENPLFQSKVLGTFPTQSEWGLVSLSWVEAASVREGETGAGRSGGGGKVFGRGDAVEIGADIARQGSCENVVYVRWGERVLAMDAWRSADLMLTAGRIALMARQWGAEVVRVDATGMGSGVVDKLREIQRDSHRGGAGGGGGGDRWKVMEVFVGARPRDPRSFSLLRDELAWGLRLRLQEGRMGGLTDMATQGQLVSMEYRTRNGKIQLESKESMLKRGVTSPDRADALILAFAEGTVGKSKGAYAW